MATVSGIEDTLALATPPTESRPGSRLRRGDVVDRYVIEALLGSGGMAEVYRGRDQRLGRDVALKLVRPVAEGDACGSLCSLLMQEARTLAGLSNPGILTVHDVGEHEGCVYLAMELIEGTTLREWAHGVDDWRARLRVLLEAGAALAAAHAAKVVHRDVKPDNILVAQSGRVVVSDFGVARNMAELDEGGHACGCAGGATVRVELDGKIVGTPYYMSPEQHEGLAVDWRSDQFGFAVTCFEVLYRRLPFAGDDLATLRQQALSHAIQPPPDQLGIPEAVLSAIKRGMKPAASARYPNMDTFVEQLARAGGVA